MQFAKLSAFTLLMTGALVTVTTFGQPRENPGGTPSQSMPGMMQGSGAMRGTMGGMNADAAGSERPQLSLALQNRAELGLAESQVTTLERLVERFRGTAQQRMRQIADAEAELAALLKQDAAVNPQVEAKVRAIEKLRADLRLERIRTIAEGRAALGAEQRAKLDHIAALSGRGMMGMRGGMMGEMQGMDGMDADGHDGESRQDHK